MLEGKKILIVDDDTFFCDLLEKMFAREGAKIVTASDGDEGLRKFYNCRPDLVILDLLMPGQNGWDVCQQIRQITDTPIIFLSALSEESSIVRGLEMGAIDYITKPINHKELLLRARLALRKANPASPAEKKSIYQVGHLTVHVNARRVKSGDRLVRLTLKEFNLLVFFLENKGKLLTSDQILAQVWGWEFQDHPEYVHVYINRLRQKIEINPQEPQLLLTEYGVGYRLANAAPATALTAAY